jgi:uncharacterized protein (DUF2237 family)
MLKLIFFSPVAFALFLLLRGLGLVPACAVPGGASPTAQGPYQEKRPHCDCMKRARAAAGKALSVTGAPLAPCASAHVTGFYRDGFCRSGADDHGVHAVCAQVTDEFLAFTRERGNDLSTPRPGFAGLHAGDGWCLCAERWQEALEAGVAPPVDLAATDAAALTRVARAHLSAHAR